jgi:hypothetical protein
MSPSTIINLPMLLLYNIEEGTAMPKGDNTKRERAERLAKAEEEFGAWFERQVNPPHRAGLTDELMAGLEAEAIAARKREEERAERNRTRRDAGYGY